MSMNVQTKIKFLPGVGPKFGAKLEKLGIDTFQDLLLYYPRTYRDFTKITKIADLQTGDNRRLIEEGGKFTIKGNILGISNKKTSRRKLTVTEAVIEDGTGSIKVVWFNQSFLPKMLPAGKEVILNGKISFNFYSREVIMESPERALYPTILPVYGEIAGLSSNFIARMFSKIRSFIPEIEEFLPRVALERNNLLGIHEALLNVHQPKDSEKLDEARRRIAFDELFMIAIRANLSKEETKKEIAPVIDADHEIVRAFIKSLPFDLTVDQEKSAEQILMDMAKKVPMNRILNGDVGSGKTVVAAIAAHAAMMAGLNVAVMAPTEILANQHYQSFKKLFSVNEVGLVTSAKKEFSNDTRIFIGTHALIQKNTVLKNLGLVIVDEQHRFGVAQRAALQNLCHSEANAEESSQKILRHAQDDEKRELSDDKILTTSNHQLLTAQKPHFLSMTATPIPRTLHLALFGDLDISVIKAKPANRKEIKTRFVETRNREKAYEFIRAHIKAGRQAFVICPLIEEQDSTKGNVATTLFEDERKTVKREYEKLQMTYPEYKIGMLHGKMKSKEKDAVMAEFVRNKLNILVSTSVVEVGVDVPNATVMVIEDAERFGLAQIHQFRGRVGRAEHQSFCFLFSPTRSSKALERLQSLEATSDGFRLAEIDLEQRGPGAVFGTEQSGMLDLKMANFSDRVLIEQASSAAKSIVQIDPELKKHPLLKSKVSDYLQNKHLE